MRHSVFASKLCQVFPGNFHFEALTWLVTALKADIGTLKRHVDGLNDNREGYNHTAIWNALFTIPEDKETLYRISLIGYSRSQLGTHMQKRCTYVGDMMARFQRHLKETPNHPMDLQQFSYKHHKNQENWESHVDDPEIMVLQKEPFPDRCGHHSSFASMTRELLFTQNLSTPQVVELVLVASLMASPTSFYHIINQMTTLSPADFQCDLSSAAGSIMKMHYDYAHKIYGTVEKQNDDGTYRKFVNITHGKPTRYQNSTSRWEVFYFTGPEEWKRIDEKCRNDCSVYTKLLKEWQKMTAEGKATDADKPEPATYPHKEILNSDWQQPQTLMMIQVHVNKFMAFLQKCNEDKSLITDKDSNFLHDLENLEIYGFQSPFKLGVLLEIAILVKLLPPECAKFPLWNTKANSSCVRELLKLGVHEKGKENKLHQTNFQALVNALATHFQLQLREVENMLCEVCRSKETKDVFFFGQDVYCVKNLGSFGDPTQEDWTLFRYDFNTAMWGRDLQPCHYQFADRHGVPEEASPP